MKHQIAMSKLNKFSSKYRIYYEDTDFAGIVYYANYLKFFERARTDMLRQKNINQSELALEKNIIFVVRKCEINYIKPAKLDDFVEVTAEVKNVKNSSVLLYQEMKIADKILAKLNVEIVCVNSKNFRPQKIDDDIKAIFF